VQRLNWTTIALIAGLVLVVVLVAYFATNRNSDQDKLTGPEISQTGAPSAEKACSSQSTYVLIKHELFSRAAQLRGSDQGAYDKLAAAAVIRMDNPVMESEDGATGAVNCSGSLSLDLPPGVAAVGGRRNLISDIDYTVDPNGRVALRNADSIIAPLATLARVGEPRPPVTAPAATNEVAPEGAETNVAASVSPAKPTGPATNYLGRPSFDCGKARTKGEIAVCQDSGLSALDVNMAAQYRRAINAASPQQQVLLQTTRDRFIAYRDRCPNRQCIGDAYVGRMREIRDIIEGRLSPR
jgi:uncharacterized protein YecT (DUF1311 family)